MDTNVPTVQERVELRALVDRYATSCDSRHFSELGALFGPAGRLIVYREPNQAGPSGVRAGAAEIEQVVSRSLQVYKATTHMIGAHTIEIESRSELRSTARGVATCRAYHLLDGNGADTLVIMAILYEDRYIREIGGWRFDERHVRLQWREHRAVG